MTKSIRKLFIMLTVCFILSALAMSPVSAANTVYLDDSVTGIRLGLANQPPEGVYLACVEIIGGELYDAVKANAGDGCFILYDIYVLYGDATPFEAVDDKAWLQIPLTNGITMENCSVYSLEESSLAATALKAEFADGYAIIEGCATGLIFLTGAKATSEIKTDGGLGDIDLDGKIGASDSRLALRFAVGLDDALADTAKKNADVDEDGKVTAADARYILRYSVGLM